MDILQLLIDAAGSETAEEYTEADIAAECLTFLGAGSDTTAITLTLTAYQLAVNPDVQERLANEIHDYFQKNAVSGTYNYSKYCVCVCVHAHACVCVCARAHPFQTIHVYNL